MNSQDLLKFTSERNSTPPRQGYHSTHCTSCANVLVLAYRIWDFGVLNCKNSILDSVFHGYRNWFLSKSSYIPGRLNVPLQEGRHVHLHDHLPGARAGEFAKSGAPGSHYTRFTSYPNASESAGPNAKLWIQPRPANEAYLTLRQ